MSYDLKLTDPVTGKPLQCESNHFIRGGTYAMGGTQEMWLNITYNYSRILRSVMPKEGIYELDGMTGAESIPLLKSAIGMLHDDVSSDYWEPTDGNVKRALCGVLALAQMRPDGVWRIT